MPEYELHPPPRLGTPAMVAIIAGAGSYALSCSGHWVWGIAAAVFGIISGFLGVLWAAIPGVKGAPLSILAILISLLALIPAILSMLGRLMTHL